MALYKANERLPKLFAKVGDIIEISDEEAKRFGDSLEKAQKGAKPTVINKPGKPVEFVKPPKKGEKAEAPETEEGDGEGEGDDPVLTDVKGIGKATATKLADAEIETIADLEAALEEGNEDIIAILGGEEKAAAIKAAIEELTEQ